MLLRWTKLFSIEVLHHNPPLPGLPDHTLPVLNHDRIDHNTKPMEHWCIATVDSVIQLQMLLFPNALCCSLYERNCVCAVTKIWTKFLPANNFCQLLRVTRKRSCTSAGHMNFLGELKHLCRHDVQNNSEVRKITHTFSIKKKINISTTIYSFFPLLSLIERYLSPLFNEVIFRFLKNHFILAFLPKRYPSLYFSLCNLVDFFKRILP